MRAWYSGCAWVSKTHEKCSIRLARAKYALLFQREKASLTRKRSVVRIHHRVPFKQWGEENKIMERSGETPQ